ncbi:hypothetical protein AALP_AA7G135200 [Arabis alpina]|uniref:Uncharacterized protein n=1 Tax=Arabis alpina TaxID=50452 RepID=A0A087GHU3_ARAAL|nr:hypothetical protein AALP_AA7G135200 [Arabis alpina]
MFKFNRALATLRGLLPKNTFDELCVRSQCAMQGYFKNKEETEKTIDEEAILLTHPSVEDVAVLPLPDKDAI